MDTSPDVTQFLLAWSDGDNEALERLMPLVYLELKRLAERYLWRERSGHTLEPTALVHEAYLKLIDQKQARWPKPRPLLRHRGPGNAPNTG